jgi:tRNA acetyltransferase TAN1
MGTVLDVGDEGIWVTYARGMKPRAVREFKDLCEEVSSMLPISRISSVVGDAR